jgi:pseudouridine-5'-phosphate glycosidase
MTRMAKMEPRSFISIGDEVARAMTEGRGVVGLETTLVTHGLPEKEGLAASAEMEAAVRESGAAPATICVMGSRVHVGLSSAEVAALARTPGVEKLNPGNLSEAVVSGRPGSTTVAATILIAARVGIRVCATGGIGGVHRGARETGDVSADLFALARYPVAIICSGAKAVLDLARTIEMLESLGVPVLGFGTDRFPAFYRRDSGLPVDARVDRVEDLAGAVRAHFDVARSGGVLVANPIPAEFEMSEDVYSRSLERAVEDAEKAGVRGRAVTPFLLERMRQLTEGASLFSNRALLVANARLAGQLAVALARPGTTTIT